ncbi:MAG TPA: hypothetical protein VHA78_03265 [Candidatus Peribacteraceae bacterium]|nr:hypothetical protein [Candidatus Peribacteraceae bacterium]
MKPADLPPLSIMDVAADLGLRLEKLESGSAHIYQEQDRIGSVYGSTAMQMSLEDGGECSVKELVCTVRKCDEEQAEKWLKKKYGGKARKTVQSGPMLILETSIEKLKPAQDFMNGTAFFTVGLFVEKDGKTIEFPYIVTSDREVFPCTIEELHRRGLHTDKLPFPQPRWSQESILAYRDGAHVPSLQDCYEYLYSEFCRYVDVGGEDKLRLLALWTLGTYCYRVFGSFPYLHLNGGAGVGKTKTLSLLAHLSFNGKHISSGSSPASIIRSIDMNGSTICIDEAEGFSKVRDEDSQRVLTLLNTGYKRGGGDEKCEQDPRTKQWRSIFFDAYSPKALAGIRSLDPTLVTRCIPIVMVRSQNRELKNREIEDRDSDFADIRSMIYPAMLQSITAIVEVSKQITHADLSGRDWELWRPILALATLADPTGHLLQRMKALATELQEEKKDMDTAIPYFLSALVQFMKDDEQEEKFFTTDELYERLASYDEDTFGWLADPFKKNARSKWIGHELRKANVVKGKAELRSINGDKCRGYLLKCTHIEDLLSAYDGYTVTDTANIAAVSEKSAVTVGVTTITE